LQLVLRQSELTVQEFLSQTLLVQTLLEHSLPVLHAVFGVLAHLFALHIAETQAFPIVAQVPPWIVSLGMTLPLGRRATQ
jgi:hypothetical protein